MRDEKYRRFQSGLIPNIPPEKIIGVRTPELRAFAKQLIKREDVFDFLSSLPHRFFDEDQLHAFILSEIKDFGLCLDEVDRFLPFIDNWATCDQLSPKVFGKQKYLLIGPIDRWIDSGKTYAVRFGIGMLMSHFLDGDFNIKYADKVVEVNTDEYYVMMMVAWYFATALSKQFEAIVPFIKEKRLDKKTHNAAIRKAVESRRLDQRQKEYLKGLKQ